jgi:outer membrane protein assembly factor BamD
VGNFYWKRDMNPAAANRLHALVDQYPLYSSAGEALFEAGDAYSKMGPRFRKQAGEEFARIVRDYPLSSRADDAKKRLEDMELPVPTADRQAYDREKYELENYKRPGMLARSTSWLRGTPDVSHAAKSGPPTMTDPKPTIPVSVPVVNIGEATGAAGGGSGTTDVTATRLSDSGTALDKQPDARSSNGTAQTASTDQSQQAPLPTNRDRDLKKLREQQAKKQAKLEKKKKKEQQNGTITQQEGTPSQPDHSAGTQGAPTATQSATKQPNPQSTGSNPQPNR